MTLQEVLARGLIRFARGKEFSKEKSAGAFISFVREKTNPDLIQSTMEEILKQDALNYAGARFFAWGEEVPEELIGSRCWATNALEEIWERGAQYPKYRNAGAVITWTTAERETQWKASASHLANQISEADFHALRSAGIEDRG